MIGPRDPRFVFLPSKHLHLQCQAYRSKYTQAPPKYKVFKRKEKKTLPRGGEGKVSQLTLLVLSYKVNSQTCRH